MRRQRKRKRPRGRNIYTIDYLLNKQPKSLAKDNRYVQMISYLRSIDRLGAIRFNRRCFSLLNEAVIEPQNLQHFYRTYRLPESPFFPLFFMIKRDYLLNKENKRKAKSDYIDKKMKELPIDVLRLMNYFREMERKCNRASLTPVFNENLNVKTKKQARIFARLNRIQWIRFFELYLKALLNEYSRFPEEKADMLLASFTLNCLPESLNSMPGKEVISRNYRKLSKELHPDAGGESDHFIKLKKSRDLLLQIKI